MRRIKRAAIDFLSLVPKGANKMPVLYKQATNGDLSLEIQTLTKAGDKFEEKGELLALAYVPNLVDSQGDYATKEAVEGMAHSFMKKGAKLDIRHGEKAVPIEEAYVAESFVVQKGDPRFAAWTDYDGKPVDATGSWAALLKIESPALRKLYREGAWNGVSFGSRDFELEPLGKAAPDDKENTMDPELLKKLLAENTASILKSMDEKIAAALPKPPAPVAGAFKGDPTNLEDIRKHSIELRRQALVKSIDFTDPLAVETLVQQLEAEHAEKLLKETPEARSERLLKENAQLKASLARAQKTSTVPATDTADLGSIPDGLNKQDMAGMAAGKRMAVWSNQQRGFAKK